MMYYKTIGDREVFSTCKSIQTNEGVWISNPTEEQIADAGWLPYVPPVVPPAPELEPDLAVEMKAVKRMFAAQTEELSDEDALEVAALFQTWASKVEEAKTSGKGVEAGERLWFNTKLYKVVQPHIPQADWTPDANPALYTEVSVVEWPEIPENIPSTAPWMSGDKGTWKEQHYICQLDNCTWNPDQYPAAWKLAE